MSLSWNQQKLRLAALLKYGGNEDEEGIALDRLTHGRLPGGPDRVATHARVWLSGAMGSVIKDFQLLKTPSRPFPASRMPSRTYRATSLPIVDSGEMVEYSQLQLSLILGN